jgi:hypothetical protein
VLSGILYPSKEEVTESWVEPHNNGFDNMYSSQNITGTIKSMRMIGAGHAVCIGRLKMPGFDWKI